MDQFTTTTDLRRWVRSQHSQGRRIGLVPTMGFLHEGHLALVDEARRRADVVVMSIFVNPLQFAPQEDLSRYPRDLARDRTLAAERGVDALFTPSDTSMYPPGSEIRVVPGRSAERWEGAARPGHFTGVLTIVAKLLHLIEPEVACFGRKDIQQLTLLRQMVRDLNWTLELAVVRTVREPDGLALSSRNVYLSADQRRHATALYSALGTALDHWRGGEARAAQLEACMRTTLATHPGVAVEYIALAEPVSLSPVDRVDGTTVVALAARIGAVRLIDNLILAEGLP